MKIIIGTKNKLYSGEATPSSAPHLYNVNNCHDNAFTAVRKKKHHEVGKLVKQLTKVILNCLYYDDRLTRLKNNLRRAKNFNVSAVFKATILLMRTYLILFTYVWYTI